MDRAKSEKEEVDDKLAEQDDLLVVGQIALNIDSLLFAEVFVGNNANRMGIYSASQLFRAYQCNELSEEEKDRFEAIVQKNGLERKHFRALSRMKEQRKDVGHPEIKRNADEIKPMVEEILGSDQLATEIVGLYKTLSA